MIMICLTRNIVTTLSDHQAQFVLLKTYNKSTQKKETLYFRDFTEMEKQKDLINTQLTNINWVEELCIEQIIINKSTNILLTKIKKLIKFWAPLQKMPNPIKKTLLQSHITPFQH